MRGAIKSYNAIVFEFVTSGYLGNLPGDPAGGKTRVVTQNSDGALFWVGQQSNGGTFTPIWEPGSSGFYDFGSLTMARTLGSDPNQVLKPGRKVIVGAPHHSALPFREASDKIGADRAHWTRGGVDVFAPGSQSLAHLRALAAVRPGAEDAPAEPRHRERRGQRHRPSESGFDAARGGGDVRVCRR